ncbi:hypothetical protein C8N37_106359 [Sphingobacterium faecium]|nr:hypothetical protein C8N37_106359 [Sphingobacterium faecium]
MSELFKNNLGIRSFCCYILVSAHAFGVSIFLYHVLIILSHIILAKSLIFCYYDNGQGSYLNHTIDVIVFLYP